MANADTRFGLRAIKNRDGSPWNGKINPYFVPATDATALYLGDPVTKTGTANTAAAGEAGQYVPGTLPEVAKSTAGDTNPITGVIIAFETDPDNDNIVYRTASTERVVWVADAPDVICEIQADSANPVAATDIGSNAALIFTHGGDNNTGLSGAELDTSTFATTATEQLKVLRIVNREDNELGENAKLEVIINNHTESNGTAGI